VNFVTYYRAIFARLTQSYSRNADRDEFLVYFRANIARSFFLMYIRAYEEH